MRGRPVGSGIDDTKRLDKIAAMLKHDPDLKLSTAMHRVLTEEGIARDLKNRMSTLRRLRDKWNGRNEKPPRAKCPHCGTYLGDCR